MFKRLFRQMDMSKSYAEEEDDKAVDICSVLEFEVGQIKLKSSLQICNLDPDANKAFRPVFESAQGLVLQRLQDNDYKHSVSLPNYNSDTFNVTIYIEMSFCI